MSRYDFQGTMEVILSNIWVDPISLLVNFSHELAQIMTTYDFYRLIKRFWAMFEPTWSNFSFFSTFDRIGTYNDQIWLHMG